MSFRLPRFYPIVDTAAAARNQCSALLLAESLLEGGARILQFRHKEPFTTEALEQAETMARLCRECGAIFIIDDRADIARMLGAGVHVGQDDLAPSDVRTVLGRSIVGYSTHNRRQLEAAEQEDVDYIALGPIFATASKVNPDPVLGTEQLRLLRPLTARPLVVIGGITRDNARLALDAGADSVAVIADLFPQQCDGASLRCRTEDWIQRVAELSHE